MKTELQNKSSNNIRKVIEKAVIVFTLGYGLHYIGSFFRTKYYAWLKTLALGEGMKHIMVYMGHINFIVVFLLYAWAVKKDRKYILSFATGKPGRNLKYALLGGITGFFMMGICILAAALNGNLEIHPAGSINIPLILLAAFAVLFQSSTEEMESRGFVFGKMNGEGVPMITAAAVSAFFFTFLHAANPGFGLIPFTSIFVIAVLFALCVYYFKNIWFVCMAHMMWNFSQDFIFGLPDSGMPSAVSIFQTTVKGSSFFYNVLLGLKEVRWQYLYRYWHV